MTARNIGSLEYPIEAIVLTIVPEEKSEIPHGEYVLIQEGGKILFPVLKLAKNWRLDFNRD